RLASEDFFAAIFSSPGSGEPSLRIAFAPHLWREQRAVMRGVEFRTWLLPRVVAGRQGVWLPFADGWRFHAYAGGGAEGREFDLRVYYSGAVSLTSDVPHFVRTIRPPSALI